MRGDDSIFKYQSFFESSFENVDNEVVEIFHRIERNGLIFDEKMRMILSFALRELFNNAVEHGNKLEFKKPVQYSVIICSDKFLLKVKDCGCGFDVDHIISHEKHECTSRVRSRGLISLANAGFALKCEGNNTIAEMYFDKAYPFKERMINLIEIKYENSVAYCEINNSIIAPNVKEMVGILKAELDGNNDYNEVVLDLSASSNIDSMGITFLIGVYKSITAKGKKVKLVGVSDAMMDLFKIMRIDEIFEIE